MQEDTSAMNAADIQIRPLTCRIGAEISGVDLSRSIDADVFRILHDALMEHLVIFFRDQDITHEDHLRFGRLFGDLAIHSGVAGLPDYPEIVAIHADGRSKFVAGENWHSDLSCNECPPMGSILYLPVVPEIGGDTLFSNMYSAYEALSPRMKDMLTGLTATHDGEHVYRPIVNDPTRRFPCNSHPVIRTHPVTGKKCLYVNSSYTTRIDQLPKGESDALLQFLYVHCMNPNFQVRFRWQPRSVAFWDNRCTQHQAVWDYFPQTRSGFRVTIAGDRPF
ncbi:Alpha-ketoglutarate-dependent taurine dioxygenase [Gluconacetobacter sp. SXCC-1]|nr:Alpha-ketoglutarate-dependent taurine dioxygenase [Gluconacetobacter sp. SXCC-1]